MSEIETPRKPDTPAARGASEARTTVTSASRGATPGPDGTIRFGDREPDRPARLTRRGRLRKWDRPPPPHDWRWYVGNLGKTLIAIGLLMFGFVAYQLWGTAIETAAAQNELEDEFADLLASVEPVSDFDVATTVGTDSGDDSAPVGQPSTTEATPVGEPATEPIEPPTATSPAVPVESQNIPALENGDALARIEIPRIGVDDIVVAGVETGDLKRGPGHFPDTPLPGQLGNSAIAGHRTTYGQPFFNVDDLEVGDEIRMTTLSGVFVYRVTGQAIVAPEDYQVVATTNPDVANLTLTSCHPKWTARERIVIFSELDAAASGPVGEPVINYGRVDEPTDDPGSIALPAEGDDVADEVADDADPSTSATSGSSSGNLVDDTDANVQLGSPEVNAGIADAFSESWFSDPGANPQVGLWGVVLGAIAIAAYALSRRLRRDWVGLLVGIVPFTMALYFFFQNVNRLLPPNL